jgi:hypothetical protein
LIGASIDDRGEALANLVVTAVDVILDLLVGFGEGALGKVAVSR